MVHDCDIAIYCETPYVLKAFLKRGAYTIVITRCDMAWARIIWEGSKKSDFDAFWDYVLILPVSVLQAIGNADVYST